MLPSLKIQTYFYHFTSVNIIEVNEQRIVKDSEHEISSKGFKGNKSALGIVSIFKKGIDEYSSLIVKHVKYCPYEEDVLRKELLH